MDVLMDVLMDVPMDVHMDVPMDVHMDVHMDVPMDVQISSRILKKSFFPEYDFYGKIEAYSEVRRPILCRLFRISAWWLPPKRVP